MKTAIVTILAILSIVSAFDLRQMIRLSQQHITQADITKVVRGNTNFAFDMFKTLNDSAGNLIFSPYSISVAMGMAFAGSGGSTKAQINKTLHYEYPRIHTAFKELNSQHLKHHDGFELKMANSFWGNKDCKFKKHYVNLVRNSYDGEVRSIDFNENGGETARLTINEWTANKTNNKIQNFLIYPPTGAPLVLVNAIYLKASWQKSFKKTGMRQFTMLNGTKAPMDMMKVTDYVQYSKGSGFKSVSLPYKGENAFMTIILPDSGKFTEVKQNFTTANLSKIFSNNRHKKVEVTMPKFKIETRASLIGNFKKLGMSIPFSVGTADFSGIPAIAIGDIIHKAVIEVDEKGTEAAAATAIIFTNGTASNHNQPIKFIANRPFLFVIHRENSVLFMGQVEQP